MGACGQSKPPKRPPSNPQQKYQVPNQQPQQQPQPQIPQYTVQIQVITLAVDTEHSLFNFEQNYTSNYSIQIKQSGEIYYGQGKYQFMSKGTSSTNNQNKQQQTQQQLVFIAQLDSKNKQCSFQVNYQGYLSLINSPVTIMQEPNIWQSLRTFKEYKSVQKQLLIGDYIRLGRVIFRVTEMRKGNNIDGSVQPHKNIYIGDVHIYKGNNVQSVNNSNIQKKVEALGLNQEENEGCRICLGDENTEDNPQIEPCRCTGSLKCVHFECLRSWLKTHVTVEETQHVKIARWKSPMCEICNTLYDKDYTVNGRIYSMYKIERPEGPYVHLEIISRKYKNKSKGSVLINFSNKNVISVGKIQSISDFVLNDLSISELQAFFKYENHQIFLEDCDSQYGSYRLLDTHTILIDSHHLAQCYQIGKNFLFFKANSLNNQT